MKKGGIIISIIALIGSLVFGMSPVFSAGGTLFLSPASGSYVTGKNFTVKVLVNSGGGVGINAGEGVIKFDPSIITVSSLNDSASVFTLWTTRPTYSNQNGTISFGGGLPPPAYTGAAGSIFTITFTAKKAGTANVSFTSGLITAADGKGTNIYAGSSGGAYTIKDAEPEKPVEKPKTTTTPPAEDTSSKGILPPAPEISSKTHPKEDEWYSSNDPEFTWKLLSDVIGVSFEIDLDSTKDPGTKSDGIVDTAKLDNVVDGINYFHIKMQNKVGWGKISHRKVMIDATVPSISKLSMDSEGDPTNPRPVLKFTAKDLASGIELYKMVIDDVSSDVKPEEINNGTYRLAIQSPGEKRIELLAIDKAGNTASSSLKYTVDALKPPIITDAPKIANSKEELIIRGTSFYPEVTVQVYIGQKDNTPVFAEVKTDKDGNWNFFSNTELDKGVYEIWAKVVDDRGAQSYDSSRHVLTIISPSIIDEYGWLIIIILIVMVLLLLVYIYYIKLKFKEERDRIRFENNEAKKRLNEIFFALHEEVDELIELADKKAGLSESERRVKEKLNEALNISEEFIGKEIADVEKEIKGPKKKE